MIDLLRKVLARTPYMVVNRRCRRGLSLSADIEAILGNTLALTIFDVGANEGQTAESFTNAFPTAKLFCFEPVQQTFERLKGNIGTNSHVSCHRLAMGAVPGKALLNRQHVDTWNSLSPGLNYPGINGAEEVEVSTIDGFCSLQDIRHIHVLKTDTEGFDLQVVRGAEKMLTSSAVDMVVSEVGVRIGDVRHTRLAELLPFLESHGYYLFALYDWPLRGCSSDAEFYNALFVSEAACAE